MRWSGSCPKKEQYTFSSEIDSDSRLEHYRMPCARRSSEVYQIQLWLLYKRNTWAGQEMVRKSWNLENLKLIAHVNKCMTTHNESISWLSNLKNDEKASHLFYSPNLVPPDFFLFTNVKRMLSEYTFDMLDEFLSATEGILSDIDKRLG
jgi:hypothetical protein